MSDWITRVLYLYLHLFLYSMSQDYFDLPYNIIDHAIIINNERLDYACTLPLPAFITKSFITKSFITKLFIAIQETMQIKIIINYK